MLEPLKQFVCDKCEGIIDKPEEGWIQWNSKIVENRQQVTDFGIVHHKMHSPNKKGDGCYSGKSSGLHLHQVLNERTMPFMLQFLDEGPYHDPENRGSGVKEMRPFVDIIRRLTIPYFEEARQYWDYARSDGFFGDINEVAIYLPETLKAVVEKYENE